MKKVNHVSPLFVLLFVVLLGTHENIGTIIDKSYDVENKSLEMARRQGQCIK